MDARPSSISVLMPIRNGARYLDRVLTALARQRVDRPWDFLAVDSGSTDGTLEIFERHRRAWPLPLRVHHIDGDEFNHGCTRNLAAALSEGELLVFLTDDAIPSSDDWLAGVLANFEDPKVGAAYCRNVTRPEAAVLVRLLNELDPAYGTERQVTELPPASEYARMGPDQRRLLFNFCDTASAVRRSVWERHPYPRCVFGEDVLLARAVLEGGYRVVFDERATVEHSHDYDAAATQKRARLDARFNAEWLGRICIPTRKTAQRLAAEQLERDRSALSATSSGAELEQHLRAARELRLAHFEGLFEGGRARDRFRRTRLLPAAQINGRSWLILDEGGASLPWRAWAQAVAAELERMGRAVRLVEASKLERLPADGALHFIAPGRGALPWLSAAILAGRPFLAQLDPNCLRPDSLAPGSADVLEACRRAAPALVPTGALRARLLAEAGFDPLQLASSPCAGLLPGTGADRTRPSTPREDALELSFRHRLLEAVADEPAPGTLLDLSASAAPRTGGQVADRGAGALELGPDGWLEFDLELPPGHHELDLHLAFAARPAGAVMDGRARLDGRSVARLGPLLGDGRRGTPLLTLPLTGGVHTIRIEGGPLRAVRCVVHRGADRKLRPSEQWRRVERNLRTLVGQPQRLTPRTIQG